MPYPVLLHAFDIERENGRRRLDRLLRLNALLHQARRTVDIWHQRTLEVTLDDDEWIISRRSVQLPGTVQLAIFARLDRVLSDLANARDTARRLRQAHG